ncbi:uncharacterized protein LOC116978604 [Amblyraja radiata]|uniref:uncharacterized protein LOC116978604 n=1 Tax=Amblyraja radiata TaxID=386614 RepID=UPI0014034C08|nr:uncharacterized protein LOC116978604 [Amblyraja radiata]
MRPKFLCSGFPDGLMFGVFVFLLRSVSTQKIRNLIYFLENGGNITLKGPDNPGSNVIVWEWEPHSGHGIQTVLTGSRADKHWTIQWGDGWRDRDKTQEVDVDASTCNLTIKNNTFKWAGFFTLSKTQPRKQILKQYEIFGIKVEADSPRPVMGSDITLSCTISRLPDTVSLHWKPRGSSQQNRRNNTDQIHLNNIVYLMIQHVGAGNPNLYTWEVLENGSIVLTGDTNVEVDQDLHNKAYTVYRSVTDHSELDLICEASLELNETKWTWRSQRVQNQEKEIDSSHRSEPIHVDMSYFGNRLKTTEGNVNGTNFRVRIVPVQFADAGVYTCYIGSNKYVTIDLITVTAEQSNAATEGDNVTLTCSVSKVTESMRLVCINGDGKIVGEKISKEPRQEEKSLQLIIPKAVADKRNHPCGLFLQNTPKVLIPYGLNSLQPNDYSPPKQIIIIIIISIMASLLFIILTVVVFRGIRKWRVSAETEDIHYGSITFQKKAATGRRDGKSPSNQETDMYLASSRNDDSSVIYAQIAQTKM